MSYQLLVDSGDVCNNVSVGYKSSLGVAWEMENQCLKVSAIRNIFLCCTHTHITPPPHHTPSPPHTHTTCSSTGIAARGHIVWSWQLQAEFQGEDERVKAGCCGGSCPLTTRSAGFSWPRFWREKERIDRR